MSPSIYNATDGPLTVDRAGRMIAAGETRDDFDAEQLEASPLSGHVEAGRVSVVTVTDDEPVEQPSDDQPTTTSTRARKGRASTQES